MRPLMLGAVSLVAPILYAHPGQAEDFFHNGGMGSCQGCHTSPPQLIRSDAGSTCLSCHEAPPGVTLPSKHYVATMPSAPLCVQLPPGGDFCWLQKSYKWSRSALPGTEQRSLGQSHGHNIVAVDYGYEASMASQFSPGGAYPSSNLTCISCHDPHGAYRRLAGGVISNSGPPVVASGSYSNSPDPTPSGTVGTYRMLAGKGYQPRSLPGATPFVADPPAAVAPPFFNRAETMSDTRVAYGSGMSEWCQNCHQQFLQDHLHPAGKGAIFSREVTDTYNSYLASGDLSGRREVAYTSMVPYEMGTNDYDVLKRAASSDNSFRTGPTGTANVMCLSCHRAHASGWDSMMRWNSNSVFIVYEGSYPGIDNGAPPSYAQGRLAVETQKTFYDRPATAYAAFQRSLCDKCHAKD